MSVEERAELAGWLKESPRHIDELLASSSLYLALDDACQANDTKIEDLLQQVDANITPLHPETSLSGESDVKMVSVSRWLRPIGLVTAACMFLVLMVMLPGLLNSGNELRDNGTHVATATGEQRSIPLPDGSIVHINTQSELRLHFTAAERRIELLKGEALFEVAHDPGRPFRVVINDSVAEAVGTKFNVLLDGDKINVAVIEGIVAFESDDGPLSNTDFLLPNGDTIDASDVDRFDDGRLKLVAGEMIELRPEVGVAEVREASQEVITSWRTRNLIFETDTLQTIVNEFNRYNTQRIIIDGNDLSQLEFSGVFHADDPEAFIEVLRLYGDIQISRDRPGEIHLTAYSEENE